MCMSISFVQRIPPPGETGGTLCCYPVVAYKSEMVSPGIVQNTAGSFLFAALHIKKYKKILRMEHCRKAKQYTLLKNVDIFKEQG